jgi:hypothetical protein
VYRCSAACIAAVGDIPNPGTQHENVDKKNKIKNTKLWIKNLGKTTDKYRKAKTSVADPVTFWYGSESADPSL